MQEDDRDGYLRTTEILTPFTGIEFVPDQFLTPASERGTRVHDIIEKKLVGFDLPFGDDIKPYMDSFDLYFSTLAKMFNEGQVTMEKRLYCDELKISGKADIRIYWEGKNYIFDWKTSSKVHKKSWALQGASYRYLSEVNGIENVGDVTFVKLLKNGNRATTHKFTNYEENIDKFKKCLELYRFFGMEKGRKQ